MNSNSQQSNYCERPRSEGYFVAVQDNIPTLYKLERIVTDEVNCLVVIGMDGVDHGPLHDFDADFYVPLTMIEPIKQNQYEAVDN